MIKLIAVDMDGTFLKSDMTYDRQRFEQLYQEMKKNDIRFVVASGNQYYQLREFFPQAEELTFVSENGAFVRTKQEDLFVASIEPQLVRDVLNILETVPEVETIVCGKNSAYTDTRSQAFYDYAHQYYVRLKKVVNFSELPDDTLFKFALRVEANGAKEALEKLKNVLGDKVIPVSSGHEDIDLILPGINKAYGLSLLAEKFGITPDQMIAFGDSGNDREMLEYVGYSFAMDNAQPEIKAASTKTIATNDEQGVLKTLEDFAANGWEYPYE